MRLKIFFLLLLTVLLALFSIFPVSDPDIWIHFTLGKYILIHHYIPKTDIFTYTCYGKPWLTHEWLVSLIFYSIFHLSGINGIIVFKFFILFFAFLFLYKFSIQLKIPAWIFSIIILLSFFTFGPGFTPRAQIFTFLFISMELYYTYLLKNNNIKKKKFAIIILTIFLFWANMHIGVLFGLGILFLFLILERPLTIKFSIFLFFASVFVVLINPNTYHLFLYPLKTIFTKNQEIKHFIIEYLPLFSSKHKGLIVLLSFKVFFAVSIFSWILNIKKRKYFYTSVSIFFALLTFFSLRFLPIFVLTSLFSILVAFKEIKIKRGIIYYNILTITIVLWSIFYILMFGIYKGQGIRLFPGFGIAARSFPSKSLVFMKKHHIYGRTYNSYNFGEYLIWNGIQVFVDGRSDVCDMSIVRKEVNIESGEGKRLIQRYHITSFLLDYIPTTRYENYSIHNYLYRSPEWKLVYWDDVSLLYLKNVPVYKEIIEKYEYKYINPMIKDWNNIPSDSIKNELKRKIKEDKNCLTAYFLLGNKYMEDGRYNEAIKYFNKIIGISSRDPRLSLILMKIGDAYMLLNDRESALHYYRLAYRFNKNLTDIKKKINTARMFLRND